MAAKLDQIKKQIAELSSTDIVSLMNDLKDLEKDARKKERSAKAEEYKKNLKLGDSVSYISGGKKVKGRVVQISLNKLQLEVDGGKRKRNIGWEDVEDVS